MRGVSAVQMRMHPAWRAGSPVESEQQATLRKGIKYGLRMPGQVGMWGWMSVPGKPHLFLLAGHGMGNFSSNQGLD